jgi:nicotinic acid phosphoribosyltransferase
MISDIALATDFYELPMAAAYYYYNNSNTKLGIPVFVTMAHSYIMNFEKV